MGPARDPDSPRASPEGKEGTEGGSVRFRSCELGLRPAGAVRAAPGTAGRPSERPIPPGIPPFSSDLPSLITRLTDAFRKTAALTACSAPLRLPPGPVAVREGRSPPGRPRHPASGLSPQSVPGFGAFVQDSDPSAHSSSRVDRRPNRAYPHWLCRRGGSARARLLDHRTCSLSATRQRLTTSPAREPSIFPRRGGIVSVVSRCQATPGSDSPADFWELETWSGWTVWLWIDVIATEQGSCYIKEVSKTFERCGNVRFKQNEIKEG
ncbi:uncharacterized protein LOC119508790 [Choloepus didactylus]|uniref:uncharacterized protein LOC119508790 n=1 Tax=Choloepus didactylus TaxID=27675 RepID=UPI00189C9590|nr:uncharacterized protein LOC119508790 [Choloepus didactylus]